MIDARHDPDRRLVVMLGQMLGRGALAQEALAVDAGRRRGRAIMRAHHLVERLLVPDLHRLLDGSVLDDEEAPALRVAAVGGALPGLEDLAEQRIGHRVRLQAPHGARRMNDLEEVGSVRHARAPLEAGASLAAAARP